MKTKTDKKMVSSTDIIIGEIGNEGVWYRKEYNDIGNGEVIRLRCLVWKFLGVFCAKLFGSPNPIFPVINKPYFSTSFLLKGTDNRRN